MYCFETSGHQIVFKKNILQIKYYLFIIVRGGLMFVEFVGNPYPRVYDHKNI